MSYFDRPTILLASGRWVAAPLRRVRPSQALSAVRRGIALLLLALATSTTACSSARRDIHSMTSAELVTAGERDTAFVRRVRMFEEIAARIPTDSLARLYVAALDAPAERAGIYEDAIACQYSRMIRQYGSIAPAQAIRRMEDSLFTTPAARERWSAAQARWPNSLGRRSSRCDTSDLPRGPDSLDYTPRKTVWP